MLDHRVYRGALVPALVVFVLAAFSLGDRPDPRYTRVAPDAFDDARAATTIRTLDRRFPDRAAGSDGDLALAQHVQRQLTATGFADAEAVRTAQVSAESPRGSVDLRVVVAERQGLAGRRIVLVAHRDSPPGGPAATLSATAVMLEMARVLADRDLQFTVVLASVSGTDAGYAGAREAVRLAGGPVEAVLVLGDLASRRSRRPWVVPWTLSGDPAPHGLRRTVEAALRTETGQSAGSVRAIAQWARRAVPVTVSPQGVVNAEGAPAVLVSATGELGPRAGDRISRPRLRSFGRAVLRAFSAIEGARPGEDGDRRQAGFGESGDGIVTLDRLLPGWAVRLLVLGGLLPALLAAVDAFFRARRRGIPGRRWLAWAASFALPFLLGWAWLRVLDVLGVVDALAAPAAPGAAELGAGPAIALGSVPVVLVLAFVLLRSRTGRAGEAPEGAAVAVGLLASVLVAAVWVVNPYAAGVLLPAAHLWLLVPAGARGLRPVAGAAAVVAGLALPLLLAGYFAVTLELGPAELLRLVFDLLAGGEANLLDAAAISLLLGLALAALAVVRAAGARHRPEGGGPIRTRGPRTYAGPGSLGGTESALRR